MTAKLILTIVGDGSGISLTACGVDDETEAGMRDIRKILKALDAYLEEQIFQKRLEEAKGVQDGNTIE